MLEDFKLIINEFEKINEKGYVKGVNNNLLNSCGLTFESLLDIKPNSNKEPDYKDIEIKTSTRFSNYPITLFTSTFNGLRDNESQYILENYGIFDKEFTKYKVFNISLKYNKLVKYDNYYLKLIKKNDGIIVEVYTLDYKLIDEIAYIDYKSIQERLELKLKKMVLILASKKILNNQLYFRYYRINCYILKNFEDFKTAIKLNDIKVSISLRFDRSNELLGKNRNKGLIFSIKKDRIFSIFKLIYSKEN